MTRPMRFAVQCRTISDGPGWLSLARRVEQLGYDMLTLPDHFDDQIGPLAALASAAAVTERIELGALVLDNDYRHPVVLAKELATIDQISSGRLVLGIGAGWMRSDYDQAGLDYDPPGTRIDRLLEALDLFEAFWTGDPVDHDGAHYRVTGYAARPIPTRRPPLLIGGGGPRMLGIAGRRADIVGINPSLAPGRIDGEAIAQLSADVVDAKVARIREAAGDRVDEVELNLASYAVELTDDREATAAGYAAMFGIDAADVLDSPYIWLGTPAEIADDLVRWRDRWGISLWTLGDDVAEPLAEVLTALG